MTGGADALPFYFYLRQHGCFFLVIFFPSTVVAASHYKVLTESRSVMLFPLITVEKRKSRREDVVF